MLETGPGEQWSVPRQVASPAVKESRFFGVHYGASPVAVCDYPGGGVAFWPCRRTRTHHRARPQPADQAARAGARRQTLRSIEPPCPVDASGSRLHRARAASDRRSRGNGPGDPRGRRGKVGYLRIGFPSATVPSRVRTIMRTFRSRFPQVARSVTPGSDGRLIEHLRHDRLDLAIVRTRTPALDDLQFMLICEEPLVSVLPRRHRLARARQIRLDDLDGERLVLFPREQNPELYDYVLTFLGEAGIRVSLIDRYRSIENRYAVVRGRNAIALVPAATAAQVRGTGTLPRRFAGRAPLAEVSLVWRKGGCRAARQGLHRLGEGDLSLGLTPDSP